MRPPPRRLRRSRFLLVVRTYRWRCLRSLLVVFFMLASVSLILAALTAFIGTTFLKEEKGRSVGSDCLAGICAKEATDTLLPHPADPTCASYVLCSGGAAHVLGCPAGLQFSPICSCCDWPANVNCGSKDYGNCGSAPQRPATTATTSARPTTTPGTMTTEVEFEFITPTTEATGEGGGNDRGGKRVVCYYPNWAYYRPDAGKFEVYDIDPSLCTHLMYAFVVLDPDTFGVKAFDPYLDVQLKNFEKFVALKKKANNVKVMAALGGWTDSTNQKQAYQKMLNDATNRSKFVNSAVSFLQQYGFDGLDLDYEFPELSDKAGFALLAREMAAALKPLGMEVTAAVSANAGRIRDGLDLASLSQSLDALHVMSYDYHGSWESAANHHAPMDEVEQSVDYLLKSGLPASKLVLGIPTYGKRFTLASDTPNPSPPVPSVGPGEAGPFTRQAGTLGYNEICAKIQQDGWTPVEAANGPYAFKGRQWVGYDTIRSVAKKARYVAEKGLAGAMIWDLSTDDFRNTCKHGKFPLLTTINNNLKFSTRQDPYESSAVQDQ